MTDETEVPRRRATDIFPIEQQRRHCDQHGEEKARSCYNSKAIDSQQKHCNATVAEVYSAINKKMPLWVFGPLLAIMVSILALYWDTSRTINEIFRKIAVIEYRHEMEMKAQKP